MNEGRSTRVVRPLLAGIAAVALSATGLSGTARAADPPADPPLPATVSADALPTWQINGVVYSQAVVGNTVYVTGSFTRARPPGVAAGGAGEVVANNIFAYDLTTGNRVSSFNHSLNAQGLVIKASPDGSRVYVGGDFTTVDGAARGHVAAFSTANGSLVSTFTPNVGGQVRALGLTASTVYVGGNFTSANGVSRTRLAAFQTSNGAMTSWAPTATGGYVWTMAMSPDGSRVIPGGSFTTLSGTAAYGMGAIDAGSAAILPWPAQEKIRTAGSNGAITTLKADGEQIYGGGYAFGAGATFEGTFGLNPSTGQINWVNDCLGDTYDVAPAGQVLYTVHHYHDCSAIDDFPDTNPRVRWQKATAQVTYPTKTTTRNDVYGWDFRGYPYAKMLHWWPDLAFGTYTSARQAAWAVDTAGDYVVMGGEFPRVNGTAQQGLTRMRSRAAAPNLRGPRYTTIPSTPVPSTNAVSLEAGTVRVSWGSAWDQDDETLKYEVLRDNNTWVHTAEAASSFWKLPRQGFIDTGLAPGSTHRYQVRITDPHGNVLWSPVSNNVTVGSGTPSAYVSSVRTDGAEHYWRLGEPSGSTGIDWTGFDDVAFSGGYTRGASGAIIGDSDAASSFDGSTGYAVNSTPLPGPNVFSEEAWFRTTSTTGGKIVSFGDRNTGTSGNYDRHIYMDPQGRIWFGVWNNGAYTVNTSNSLNDGQWHHVVGTMDSSGLTLYVDGKRIGRNGGTSIAQPYTGYWRIGGDSAWNGNPYFNGDIDDVALYPTALSLPQVQKHYTDSGRTLNIPAPPADDYGKAVYAAEPDFYWRLGEASGPTAVDQTANELHGVYSGGVTFGEPGGVGGTNNTAVALDGSNGNVSAVATVTNPTVYSEELWFKTTTTRGGKLIGLGNSATGNSSSYDRHVYMFDDGRLRFGVWTGSMNVIDSPQAYNDGAWHHMVATQGPDGMKLWVDGILVGTNPQTQAENYTGYWRIGGDTTWGGNSSNWFAGSVDEAAVYSKVLDQSEVRAHFQAGGGLLPNESPTASFTYTVSTQSVSVDGSASGDPDGSIASYAWDFGDGGTGTSATANHTYAAAGTYTVTLTVTDNRGATATTSKSVTVVENQAPTASFTSAVSGRGVSVNGSGSSDPDGSIASYAWDFGDGGTATGATASHTYAADGTYTVTLTVTDNGGATGSTTRSVTVAAPQVYAADDFGRSVTDGWGTADIGGAWTLSGPATRWSVAGGMGRLSLNAGNGYTAHLPSVSSTNTEVRALVTTDKAPTGGGQYTSVIGRRVSATQDYRAKLRFASNGSVTVWLTRMQSGTETVLTSVTVPGLSYTAGDRMRVRLQVTGTSPTTVRVKVWEDGTAEPANWLLTGTDSTAGYQVPGSVAFYMYASGSITNPPVVYGLDELWIGPS